LKYRITGLLIMSIALICSASLQAQTVRTHTSPGLGNYDTPFWADGEYSPDIQSPDEFLGFTIGSRPVEHSEVLRYFSYLDQACPYATLHSYGKTFEGRRLVYLSITSAENQNNLAEIRKRIAKLADPRLLGSEAEAKRIISRTPAVAWMAYSIHGDELSSTDAALWLAYQIIAGTDDQSRLIRNNTIVCIDPLENPDGRTRWIGQLQQWNTTVPNPDIQSLNHRGFWTRGRGNHYLFDLNRDWFSVIHPETRGKIKAILDWHPQFLVDCHEMGSTDTYMFSPPREPFNPYMISQIQKWWKMVSRDQGAALDRYGWSYYTREWNEEIFPGYGSSWSIYIGAIGMLYEQARMDGSQVKRPDGTIMTYRESIHHQFVSSMANLLTVAGNRQMLLEDYFTDKKQTVGGKVGRPTSTIGKAGAYLFPTAANTDRLERFAKTLQDQAIEVYTSDRPFKISRAVSAAGGPAHDVQLPEGTLVVPLNQPLQHLINTILAFDIRLDNKFLQWERRETLKNGQSKLYEITGWSIPLAYGLEGYHADKVSNLRLSLYAAPHHQGEVIGNDPAYGYVLDATGDRSYRALARLLEKGIQVWCAKKPFGAAGQEFPPGSYLIRLDSNPGLKLADIQAVAGAEGVTFYTVNSSLANTGADLGGTEFHLLEAPRVALLGGSGLSTTSFGALWHLIDVELGLRASTLDAAGIARVDLAKYNVLIVPDAGGGPRAYANILGKPELRNIKNWLHDGGTLIAMGGAAAYLADSSVSLSDVQLKRQALEDLPKYTAALESIKDAEAPVIDSLDVWEAIEPKPDKSEPDQKKAKPDMASAERADKLARALYPHGAILAVDLDPDHWLSYGCGKTIPALFYTQYALMAKSPVQVPARLAPPERLRLSGLLWPEARNRWSETVYATREGAGKGQVILFATQPNFRGYFHGSGRLLLNAILLGPGFGARQTIDW
jgi:hypothetical protein